MSHPFRALAPSRLSDRLSSLILHWTSDDQSIDCLSGQVGTFVRATAGGAMVDANGALWHSVRAQPRFEMVRDAQTGLLRPGLLLEPARTNLAQRSEDFSAVWADIGTPIDTANAATAGDLVLTTLNDDTSGTLEGYSQILTFTGNTVKAITVFVKQGTSTSWAVRLRDTTAPANRLLAVGTWVGSVPSIAMTTGTFVGQRALANGIYELRFLTTAVTAANNNQLEIYPATTSGLATANTGTLAAAGVAGFNSITPLSYLRTPASATVAADAEVLTWPFVLPRRRVWLYGAFTDLGARHTTGGGAGLAVLGDISGAGLGAYWTGSGLGAFHYTTGSGGGPSPVAVNQLPIFGALVEYLITMDATGAVQIEVAFDGVSQGVSATGSAAVDMTTAWTSSVARLGAFGSSGGHIIGGAAYHSLKVGEYGLSTPTLAKARRYW